MYRTTIVLLAIAWVASAQSPSFRWIQQIDGSDQDQFGGLATDAQGNSYVVGNTRSASFPVRNAVQGHLASAGKYDVFVTRLDPSGNVVYSTSFGGAEDDNATAMAVDAAGNVYVAGTMVSADFPTTPGTFSPAAPAFPASTNDFRGTFVFRLKPDGSLGYPTYFTGHGVTLNAMAVAGDGASSGSIYLTGSTIGGLPVTPGAYQSVCNCAFIPNLVFGFQNTDAFLARFDTTGNLQFATYLGVQNANGRSLVVGPDGNATLGGLTGVYRLDGTGSSLLASNAPALNIRKIALAPDGSLYAAGEPNLLTFQPTPGALQARAWAVPLLPALGEGFNNAIVKLDTQLHSTVAATDFGGPYGLSVYAMTVDPAGNLYLGGTTSPRGFSTRTLLAQAFGSSGSGFLTELSGDLSTLLFSSNFGDTPYFSVGGVGLGPDGAVVIGGATSPSIEIPYMLGSVWVNSLTLIPPPALRVDSIVNAASLVSDPSSAGETIQVQGAGFGSDAQLLIDGVTAKALSVTPGTITAVVPPSDLTYATIQVFSGRRSSNAVLAPPRLPQGSSQSMARAMDRA